MRSASPSADPAPAILAGAPPARALAAWLSALDAAGALAPLDARERPLADALGQVTAAVLRARHDSPPHRCAAMDGVAVRAADTAGATPEALAFIAAGDYEPVDTGGPVGDPWDAVVPVEETGPDPAGVRIRHATEPGCHVRPAGEDVAAGSVIVRAGRRLGPYDAALAAACGHATVPVRRPPRVVIVPTGDEIRPAGAPLGPGEAADSNSVMLLGQARDAGADPVVTPIVPDDPEALRRALREAAADADVVLFLAGSSRGSRDHTADVLEAAGAVVARGVALRPAHPVILGRVGRVPVIGVPGYPVSAAITFDRFARPVLERLLGAEPAAPATVRVRLARAVHGRRDAEVVVPLVVEPAGDGGVPLARPQSRRGAALAGLARASAFLCIEAGGDPVPEGAIVSVERLA